MRFFLQLLELLQFFGHKNLQKEDLAGVLSECGYTGDRLRTILLRVEPKSVPGLSRSKSVAAQMYDKALDHPVVSRVVPESASGVYLSMGCAGICCCGIFWVIIGAQKRI